MTYTEQTEVFLAPGEAQDISEGYWVKVLERAGSFDVDALWAPFDRGERPEAARQLYRRVKAARQRASYWLAKPFEEHGAGTNSNSVLWRGKTRSWGNATSVRLRTLTGWSMYDDPIRGRDYVRYANVIDSIEDALFRITDPTFVYVQEGRRTVRQVGERFVGLSENTDNYVGGLVRRMNQFIAEDTGETPVAIEIPGLPYRVMHITTAKGIGNRPGMFNPAEWITVHTTANRNPTAGALMHRNFVQNGGGVEGVSFQQAVDALEAIEIMGRDEASWNAGDGYNGDGNRKALAIEACENGDWQQVFLKLGRLIAWDVREGAAGVATILTSQGIDAAMSRVVQHNHWSGKNCPGPIRAAGTWPSLLANARGIVVAATAPPTDKTVTIPGLGTFPQSEVLSFPDRVGFHIILGFRAFWQWLDSHGKALAWRSLGYPMSNEFKMLLFDPTGAGTREVTVQEFERGALIYDPANAGNDWGITFAKYPQRYAIRRALGYPVDDLQETSDITSLAA